MEGGNIKIVARNKKARFDYELSDRFEAGLVLTGTEVKSLRMGKASLGEAYAKVSDGEAWLVGCQIQPYPFAYYDNHEPTRQRKLLLHKRELKRLGIKVGRTGLQPHPHGHVFQAGQGQGGTGPGQGQEKAR